MDIAWEMQEKDMWDIICLDNKDTIMSETEGIITAAQYVKKGKEISSIRHLNQGWYRTPAPAHQGIPAAKGQADQQPKTTATTTSGTTTTASAAAITTANPCTGTSTTSYPYFSGSSGSCPSHWIYPGNHVCTSPFVCKCFIAISKCIVGIDETLQKIKKLSQPFF